MGGFPEAVAGLSRGAIDGAMLSPPHSFRMFKEGFRELVTPKDLRALGSGFLSQGIVARRSFANQRRDVVIRLIRATVEATKHIVANEDHTKRSIAKYLGVSDAELLRLSYLYATETFAREPFVPEVAMQSMVQRMVEVNMIDAKSAQSTPVSAFFDNSYVAELKQSGFLDSVWK
jgi:ABC-type nitrate/sulfonate/bicarbonate transport system substrate-binding protein